MSEFTVTRTRIQAGIWEGVVTARGETQEDPAIEVLHKEAPVHSFALTPDEADTATWQLRIAIPPRSAVRRGAGVSHQ
jgi:hypothetical protein